MLNKSRIRETPTLLTDATSSSDTIKIPHTGDTDSLDVFG